ncbi:hypothetical protein KR054_001022 [Drosophila jambulina]|nr:hypothetical protein KR054_001022 [Drosophila jambulina]
MSTRCYIIDLPVEILALVYKSIPDMRDKLNLAKAHCVLGEAFASYAGNTFKEIEIKERPIFDWLDILSLCGVSVSGITLEDSKAAVPVVKLASMYCPNLEKLFIPVRTTFWDRIKPLILTLENLSSISLMNYDCLSCDTKFNVVDTLLRMPKLTNLQLCCFNFQDWQRVGELVNLTELTIKNIRNEPIDMFKVCSPLKGLKNLVLGPAFFRMPKDHVDKQLWPKIKLLQVHNGTFDMSLPYLATLKELNIDELNPSQSLADVLGQSADNYGKSLESLSFFPTMSTDDLKIIMKLKALKRLEFSPSGDDWIGMDYISQLENLEELILRDSPLTNRGVMMVINKCKQLRLLDLHGCHGMIDIDIIEEAVAALHNFHISSDKPLVLVVGTSFGKVDKVCIM